MASDRDVGAFDKRAARYEDGWLGRFHRDIAERSVEIALNHRPRPTRVLDVGCGTGYLIRHLAERAPSATMVIGVEPAPAMLRIAQRVVDGRVQAIAGVAEQLPFAAASFDLVLSTTSFDHWGDQREGLSECRRIIAPGGHLLLVDLFCAALLPTLVGSHRRKARTMRRLNLLFASCGFDQPVWCDVFGRLIRAAVTVRDDVP